MARTPDERLIYLNNQKKLSPMEYAFMKVIWAHPDGASTDEIHSAFTQARGTKTATLSHIVEKGYLRLERVGQTCIYHATVTELEYNRAIMKQKMEKYLGTSSIASLVGMFCGKDSLSPDEQSEIEDMIRKLEE